MESIKRLELNELYSSKTLLFNIIFIFLFLGCSQTKTDNKTDTRETTKTYDIKESQLSDTVSLRVLKVGYIFSYKGQKQQVETQEQLLDLLEKKYNRQDTLYVFIEDAFEDRITETLKSINDLKINKRKIIMGNDYFKFPN